MMRKRSFRTIATIVTTTMCLSALAACGKSEPAPAPASSVPAPAVSVAEEPTPEPMKTIGTEADGEYIYKTKVANMTGKGITDVIVRTEKSVYGESLMTPGDVFLPEEERMMYFNAENALKEYEEALAKEAEEAAMSSEAVEAESAASDAESIPEGAEGDFFLFPEYTVTIVFDDETSVDLHQFPFQETDAVNFFTEEFEIPEEYLEAAAGEEEASEASDAEAADGDDGKILLGYITYVPLMDDAGEVSTQGIEETLFLNTLIEEAPLILRSI